MLRHWFYFAGLMFIGLTLMNKWVAFTLSKQIQGLHLSILGYVPGHHVNPLLSFGFVAAVLFAIAVVCYSRRYWRLLTITGAIILLLALFSVMQAAFLHSNLLKELQDEEIQARGAADFTKRFLPTNAGSEASDAIGIKGLPTETVWQRFIAGWYFMGFGWYVTVAYGLSAFLYGTARIRTAGGRVKILMGTALATAVLVIGCTARSFLAHVAFANGQQAESRGDPARAVSQYQQAMRLDGWYAINTAVYKRIGAIDAAFGRVDTFEYAVYHAELMVAENNYPAAVAEYERLVETGGEHARFLKARCYEVLNNYGAQLYLAGAIGDASRAWQEVLTLNPTQWLAIYCLSTAYFDTGRYQESIDMIVGLLKGLADPELRANLNSNLGDAYTRLGDYQHAHLAYRYSYFVDNILNWRALMSLVGSG